MSRDDPPQGDDRLPPVANQTAGRSTVAMTPRALRRGDAAPVAPRSASTFAPGDVVAGRYRIVRFIAGGGIGEVYEALNTELGERVALKVLQPKHARDDAAVERFKREIQLARRVTHPNVCRIYDAGLHGAGTSTQAFYLTMEFLGGETLRRRIERCGRLGDAESRKILRQVCAGLDAAHVAGIVHRDFKAANVLLAPSETGGERAVITDFGLARALEPEEEAFRTAEGGVVGTPAFMAPEQVEGGEVTPATDIYALGVLLYCMLTGQLPFPGRSPVEIALKRLSEDPVPPRQLVPELDPRWEALILACLQRQPADRPSQPLELLGSGAARRRQVPGWLPWTATGMAVAALLWALLRPSDRPSAPLIDGRTMQLTADPGLEMDPDLSPDGESLVYSSDRTGAFELYLRQLSAGANEVQLTRNGGQAVQPAWAPDGRWIAYHDMRRGGVWVLPALGGTARRVASFGSRPCWSPDGTRLAFQEDRQLEIAARAAPAESRSNLWVVEFDGSQPPQPVTEAGHPLGGHAEPSWSPDGTRLAFSVGDRRSAAIWTIALDGSAPAPLLTGWRASSSPTFSADGRSLFFSGLPVAGREAATLSVWRLPLGRGGRPSGEPEEVTSVGSASIRHFVITADGSRMIYGSLSTSSNLWKLDPSSPGGQGPLPVTTGNGRNNRPAISPDGRRVAYDSWRIGSNLDIWIADLLSDGPPQALTLDAGRDSQSSWAPDGRRLAFVSERDGRAKVWAAEVDGGGSELLADLGTDFDWVRLSPDGRQLAYNSRKGSGPINVWLRDLATGADRQLTHDDELMGFPAWSPDGRQVAVEGQRGDDSHVMLVDVDSGETRQLTNAEGKCRIYSWSPDGAEIAFAGLRNGYWNLFAASSSTGESRQLTDYRSLTRYVRYPAWSPVGRLIVFELAETSGDLWTVERR